MKDKVFIKRILLLLNTVVSYLLLLIIAIFIFVPLLILLCVIPQSKVATNKFVFWLLHIGYAGTIYALLMPIKIQGTIPFEPSIIIANHQSAIDIPVIGYLCNSYPHMWYVLDYYARKPILSFFTKRLGVSVTRDNGIQAAKSLLIGLKKVADKPCHTLIFPEGGRFIDKNIHPFLGGFAIIARKTGRPVVPVYLKNLGTILPPGFLSLQARLPIDVIVGPLYYYGESETDEQFVARVYEWFQQQQ